MTINHLKKCLVALDNIRSIKWQRHLWVAITSGLGVLGIVCSYIFEKDASEEFDKKDSDNANRELDYIFDSSIPIEESADEQIQLETLER